MMNLGRIIVWVALLFALSMLKVCENKEIIDISFYKKNNISTLPNELMGQYIDPFTNRLLSGKINCGSRYMEIDNIMLTSYCGETLIGFCPIKNITEQFRRYFIKCDKLSIGSKSKLTFKKIDKDTTIPNSIILFASYKNQISIVMDTSGTMNGNFNKLIK